MTYDFVILDLDMPIMDGYEACSKIKQKLGGDDIRLLIQNTPKHKEHKEPLVIALSALINDEVYEKGMKAGFNEFSKTF